jgi:V/A-type H+-transporting ATPase subunit B
MQHGSLITVEYQTVNYVSGPLIFVERPKEISFGETAQIILPDGEARTGQILDISEDIAVVQVFEGTRGIDSHVTTVRFTGQSQIGRASCRERVY